MAARRGVTQGLLDALTAVPSTLTTVLLTVLVEPTVVTNIWIRASA